MFVQPPFFIFISIFYFYTLSFYFIFVHPSAKCHRKCSWSWITIKLIEILETNCFPTTFHDIAGEDEKYIMRWYFRHPIPKTRCSYWWVIDWGPLAKFTLLVKVQGRDIPSGASWKYIMHRTPWILQSLPIQYKIRRHPLTNQANRLCK